MSGNRLIRLSIHSVLKASEWFCFITMERKKGEMKAMVKNPQTALPAQCVPVHSTENFLQIGSARENMIAMTAAERIP